MQIKVKDKGNVFFKDIKQGEVFMDNDEDGSSYYIKTDGSCYDGDLNSVDLKTGDSVTFSNDTKVFQINAKLIIE
jgi:hypothetical protein